MTVSDVSQYYLLRVYGGRRTPAYRNERIRPEVTNLSPRGNASPQCSDSHWVTESWIHSFAQNFGAVMPVKS
jgi:hypothetical protein